ncbi:hypothetical protein BJV82DRAFT_705704 [Fennellomyces sp. T-0311]|nr:hypothetical protein BJV82DRAFT_705704 [Fennellomyces sp. T-0311]
MAFKFNFTSDDLDLDDVDQNGTEQIDSSLGDLSLEDPSQKVPSKEFNINACPLPGAIQADALHIPGVDTQLYKRTLADVKFQMAEQDTLLNEPDSEEGKVVDMLNLNSNSDLVRGVYEGGFKTWECSLDLAEYLSQLPKDQITGKRILELGCGSALPSLVLLAKDLNNQVDVQDYNDQVIRYITIPNILLNTVLTVEETSTADAQLSDEKEESSSEEEDDDEEKDQIIGDTATCDAEAELPAERVPDMLRRVSERTRAFVGDWSGLPALVQDRKYNVIITSETIYSQEALPALIDAIQSSLQKPDGVW